MYILPICFYEAKKEDLVEPASKEYPVDEDDANDELNYDVDKDLETTILSSYSSYLCMVSTKNNHELAKYGNIFYIFIIREESWRVSAAPVELRKVRCSSILFACTG